MSRILLALLAIVAIVVIVGVFSAINRAPAVRDGGAGIDTNIGDSVPGQPDAGVEPQAPAPSPNQ